MKGGIGYNLRISGFELYLQDIYLLILSREIDIKLCQNYTKTGICQILYKSCSFKQIIFNNYATILKTILSHRSLRISGLLILYFLFCITQPIWKVKSIISIRYRSKPEILRVHPITPSIFPLQCYWEAILTSQEVQRSCRPTPSIRPSTFFDKLKANEL